MWSFVGAKATARWLWHALDHRTGRVLAYVVGSRKDAVFLKLRALLAPFGITPVLHRQGGCLSAASSARAAHGREADDAEDRAQAPHVADASQTPRPQDALFFPLARHARPPHRVIYEPGGIRPCSMKRAKYRIGTLPRLLIAHLSRFQARPLLAELVKHFGCPAKTPRFNDPATLPMHRIGH